LELLRNGKGKESVRSWIAIDQRRDYCEALGLGESMHNLWPASCESFGARAGEIVVFVPR
jgi:hypothetical protein